MEEEGQGQAVNNERERNSLTSERLFEL